MNSPQQPSPTWLKYIHVQGLHGTTNIEQNFNEGLNILHSKNGDGKTTLLHIIANILEAELEQFLHLKFDSIQIESNTGHQLAIVTKNRSQGREISVFIDREEMQSISSDESAYEGTSPAVRKLIREHLGGRPVYLPAFRTILEALHPSTQRRYIRGFDSDDPQPSRIFQRERDEERRRSRDQMSYYGRRSDGSERARIAAAKTHQCRQWFGPFTPMVRFPSLTEVEQRLVEELTSAQLSLGTIDRESFSSVFSNLIDVMTSAAPEVEPPKMESLLTSIKDRLEKLESSRAALPDAYAKIASAVQEVSSLSGPNEHFINRVLSLYEDALSRRIKEQERAFRTINTFEESVNQFLRDSGKCLRLELTVNADNQARTMRRHAAYVSRSNNTQYNNKDERIVLSNLSSGERHILTLLFSVTHMSQLDGTVLFDEPELSLHVDWQRLILSEMCKQVGQRQVIACTHAPEVAAEHLDRFVPLEVTEYKSSDISTSFDVDDGE